MHTSGKHAHPLPHVHERSLQAGGGWRTGSGSGPAPVLQLFLEEVSVCRQVHTTPPSNICSAKTGRITDEDSDEGVPRVHLKAPAGSETFTETFGPLGLSSFLQTDPVGV